AGLAGAHELPAGRAARGPEPRAPQALRGGRGGPRPPGHRGGGGELVARHLQRNDFAGGGHLPGAAEVAT
ncbi:unnamed protein product, partial [Heterosigma akashiwo]